MMNVLQPPKTAFGAQPYKSELSLAATGPYHNNLEPFLGPPTKAIDHNPSDQFPHEAWFLPDAYMGDAVVVQLSYATPRLTACVVSPQVATIMSERRSYRQWSTTIPS